MVAQPQPMMTEAEYLAFERASETKHEYVQGMVYAMVGASEAHNLIVLSTALGLYQPARARGCRVYANDMRVKIAASGLYTYPDIVVVCGQPQFTGDQPDTLTNPAIVIEVLSPSTERYDRGEKFLRYQTLPSLREYLLVAQETFAVEHYARQATNQWLYTAAISLEATIHLSTLGADLALAAIYEQLTPQE